MTAKTISSLMAAAGIFTMTMSGNALAERPLPYETELNTCIAAIHERIDLDGANRVRYIVRDTDSSMHGYELDIDTVVFSDSSQKQTYRVVCQARGSFGPTRLVIDGNRV